MGRVGCVVPGTQPRNLRDRHRNQDTAPRRELSLRGGSFDDVRRQSRHRCTAARRTMNSPNTVLVAGASGLVGTAAAIEFADAGWNVIAVSRRRPELLGD